MTERESSDYISHIKRLIRGLGEKTPEKQEPAKRLRAKIDEVSG